MVDPIRPKTGPLQGPLPTPASAAPTPPAAAPEAQAEKPAKDALKLSNPTGGTGNLANLSELPDFREHHEMSFGASVEALAAQALHAGPGDREAMLKRVDELLQEGRENFSQSQASIRGHMKKLEQMKESMSDASAVENTRKTQKLSPAELAAELAKALRMDENLEKAAQLAEQAKQALEHDDGFQHMSGPVKDLKAGLEHLDEASQKLLENCPPQLREAMEELVHPARTLLGGKAALDELNKALEAGAPSPELAMRTLDVLEGMARALLGLPEPIASQAQDLLDTAAAGRRALAGGGR